MTAKRAHVLAESTGELYRQLVDNLADYAVFVIDRNGYIADWNRSAHRVYGYEADEIVGNHISRLSPPDQLKAEGIVLARVMKGSPVHELQAVRIRRDGARIDVLIFMSPIRDARGRIIGAFKVVRDITERKQVMSALQDSEHRLRAILETAVEAIITITDRGIIESANPAACTLFGYDCAAIIGQNVRILMPEPYRAEHDTYLRRYMETGHAKIIGLGREVTGVRKDGSLFPMHLSISEVKLENVRLFTGIIHDLTERRALESSILEASANEQRRIGQDLHDGLCQELVALGFQAKLLADQLRRCGATETDVAVQMGNTIAEIASQARQLSHGLNPVDVKAGGLEGALGMLATKVSNSFAVRCTFRFDPAAKVTNDTTATHLYRIAQEAVSNAIRHGKAKRVDITLLATGRTLTLGIKDNGVGLRLRSRGGRKPTPPHTDPQGIGLQTMQYRARVIGGDFLIQPARPRGTLVTCRIQAGAAR